MCGSPIGSTSTYCVNCVKIVNRKIKNRPNREELKFLIRNKSFLEIGREYGVSDNTIRKWCDTENLPRKKTEINKISDEEWINI